MSTSKNIDTHSFAAPEEAVVTHLNLELTINFEDKILAGKARYRLKKANGVSKIVLDTKDLLIQQVLLADTIPGTFHLRDEKAYLGRALEIALKPDTEEITIFYQTSPNAAALQWLTPAQTAGREYPFMFTQSQAILARTWLPCQDSPSIRFTYEATVRVPAGFLALMSAHNPQQRSPSGTYSFHMPYPIPSYLMALAAGNIRFQPIGPRTGVYAEPETLAAAAYEFAEMENMLVAAENLYGHYPWGRYDMLVLPPSFPFGGMENPCLTFATPTIIAGDRSLTSLVAHEMAHSWSGNLVTNATWNDFWLNEGFTVYFERRIMEYLYGPEYADMLKVLGYQELQHTLNELGRTSPDTCLHLNLIDRDPDEGLTEIAYEKGNLFLLTLEKAIGRERFDQFVNHYFATYRFQSNDTENFLHFLYTSLADVQAILDTAVKPSAWIYAPDLPDTAIKPTSAKFIAIDAQVSLFQKNTDPALLGSESWSTHEWLYFLHQIEPGIEFHTMQVLDNAFHFTHSGNAEIRATWLQMALKTSYTPAAASLETFLTNVGRRKFVMPLFKLLIKTETGKKRARLLYDQVRPNYHAVTRQAVEALLTS